MSEQRRQIVKKACDLYGQYGIKSVSMDDICRELGISKKTLYTVFEQKEDLVEAVLDGIQQEFEQRTEELASGSTSIWLALSEMLDHIAQLPDIRKMPPFFYDLNKYYPAIAKAHTERVRAKNIEVLERVLLAGAKEGIFRVDLDMPVLADWLARMQGRAMEQMAKDEGLSHTAILRTASDVILRGIMTPEAVEKYETLKG